MIVTVTMTDTMIATGTKTGTMVTGTMATGINKDSGNRAGHGHSVSDRLQRGRFDECHNK